ncbi:hypothetical protein EDB87DRAFT_1704818 [Lactarius vividus]|nr:hypothetical protein EDB87DRAFT_1704818 [Lactarius vividus]
MNSLAHFYGFPSNPISVYRTGHAWPVPRGPQAQCVPREPRPVYNHPIQAVWCTVGVQVYKSLDSIGVKWSTIDPVRFAEQGGEAGPLYLWVGVEPRSLSLAFRESIFARSTNPQLLNHTPSGVDPTADLRSPFTPALGVQIAPLATPHFGGIGALAHRNELYVCKNPSQPRHEVLILGSEAYQDALEAMKDKIRRELILVHHYKRELAALGEAGGGPHARHFEGKLTEAEMTITAVDEFHDQITDHWSTVSQRMLGYVVYAPPISVGTGPKKFTDHWALIDLYLDKIDWGSFKGNVIYLGNKISADDFPIGGLLQVNGVVKEDEIRQPTQLDANGEECLLVIKNGKSTGVTIGRGTSIESFIREYDEYGTESTSTEVAIHSYSHKDGAFSASGDSGSIVVDGLGRIVGLLTGGTGSIDYTDVTYLTPYFWLEERIKQAFPDSYLYPIKA